MPAKITKDQLHWAICLVFVFAFIAVMYSAFHSFNKEYEKLMEIVEVRKNLTGH